MTYYKKNSVKIANELFLQLLIFNHWITKIRGIDDVLM